MMASIEHQELPIQEVDSPNEIDDDFFEHWTGKKRSLTAGDGFFASP